VDVGKCGRPTSPSNDDTSSDTSSSSSATSTNCSDPTSAQSVGIPDLHTPKSENPDVGLDQEPQDTLRLDEPELLDDEQPSQFFFKKLGELCIHPQEDQACERNTGCQLITSNSQYGITVFADTIGLYVMKTADLLREAIDIEHSKPEDADEMWAPILSSDKRASLVTSVALEGIYMLELSRDGQILAVCTGNELVLYDMYTLLSTEKQEAGCHLRMPNESQALHVQWGPSGTVAETQLLVVTSNGDLLRGEVFEASHADTKLTLLASNVTGSASWSPRGTHAAYASPKGVHVFHMQDKAILHSVEMLGGAVESVAWVAAGRILIGSRIVIQGYCEEEEESEEEEEVCEDAALWAMTWQADGEQEDGAHLAFHTPRLYHVERAWNGGGETLADSQYLRSPLMLTHYMEGWDAALVAHRWMTEYHVSIVQCAGAAPTILNVLSDKYMFRLPDAANGAMKNVSGMTVDYSSTGVAVEDITVGENKDNLPSSPVLLVATMDGCLAAFTVARCDREAYPSNMVASPQPLPAPSPAKPKEAQPAPPSQQVAFPPPKSPSETTPTVPTTPTGGAASPFPPSPEVCVPAPPLTSKPGPSDGPSSGLAMPVPSIGSKEFAPTPSPTPTTVPVSGNSSGTPPAAVNVIQDPAEALRGQLAQMVMQGKQGGKMSEAELKENLKKQLETMLASAFAEQGPPTQGGSDVGSEDIITPPREKSPSSPRVPERASPAEATAARLRSAAKATEADGGAARLASEASLARRQKWRARQEDVGKSTSTMPTDAGSLERLHASFTQQVGDVAEMLKEVEELVQGIQNCGGPMGVFTQQEVSSVLEQTQALKATYAQVAEMDLEQRTTTQKIVSSHQMAESSFAEVQSLWEMVSAEREEEANEKPALDARTLAQRSAIREELSSITQKMEEVDKHLNSLELAYRQQRQQAAKVPTPMKSPLHLGGARATPVKSQAAHAPSPQQQLPMIRSTIHGIASTAVAQSDRLDAMLHQLDDVFSKLGMENTSRDSHQRPDTPSEPQSVTRLRRRAMEYEQKFMSRKDSEDDLAYKPNFQQLKASLLKCAGAKPRVVRMMLSPEAPRDVPPATKSPAGGSKRSGPGTSLLAGSASAFALPGSGANFASSASFSRAPRTRSVPSGSSKTSGTAEAQPLAHKPGGGIPAPAPAPAPAFSMPSAPSTQAAPASSLFTSTAVATGKPDIWAASGSSSTTAGSGGLGQSATAPAPFGAKLTFPPMATSASTAGSIFGAAGKPVSFGTASATGAAAPKAEPTPAGKATSPSPSLPFNSSSSSGFGGGGLSTPFSSPAPAFIASGIGGGFAGAGATSASTVSSSGAALAPTTITSTSSASMFGASLSLFGSKAPGAGSSSAAPSAGLVVPGPTIAAVGGGETPKLGGLGGGGAGSSAAPATATAFTAASSASATPATTGSFAQPPKLAAKAKLTSTQASAPSATPSSPSPGFAPSSSSAASSGSFAAPLGTAFKTSAGSNPAFSAPPTKPLVAASSAAASTPTSLAAGAAPSPPFAMFSSAPSPSSTPAVTSPFGGQPAAPSPATAGPFAASASVTPGVGGVAGTGAMKFPAAGAVTASSASSSPFAVSATGSAFGIPAAASTGGFGLSSGMGGMLLGASGNTPSLSPTKSPFAPSGQSFAAPSSGSTSFGAAGFGQSAVGGGGAFGASTQARPFGAPAGPSTTSAFGAPASSASAFGTPGAAFGAASGSSFGQPGAAFAASPVSKSAFGAPGGAFGQPAFAAPAAGGFGQAAGKSQPGGFGGTPFGQAAASPGGFGQASPMGASKGAFGQAAVMGGFGQPAAMGVGLSSPGGFGQPAAMGGSAFGQPSGFGQTPSAVAKTSPSGGGAFGSYAGTGGSVFGSLANQGGGFGGLAAGASSGFGTPSSPFGKSLTKNPNDDKWKPRGM